MKLHDIGVKKFCELVPSYQKVLDLGYEPISDWFNEWYQNGFDLSEINCIDVYFGEDFYIEINKGNDGDGGITVIPINNANTIHVLSWDFIDAINEIRKQLGWLE